MVDGIARPTGRMSHRGQHPSPAAWRGCGAGGRARTACPPPPFTPRRTKRQRVRPLWLILLAIASASAACSPRGINVSDLRLSDGRVVSDLFDAQTDSTVILLYHANDCFRCFGTLSLWMRWTGDVRLVLVEQPDVAAQQKLAEYKLTGYEVLNRLPRGLAVPSTYLFVSGEWIAAGVVRAGDDPIYRLVAGFGDSQAGP